MKIRVISDLHLDVNDLYPFSLEDKDTFTIICGDTSGNPSVTNKWIAENIKHGIFIAGNHLVYNHLGKSIKELRDMLAKDHGIDSDVTYLDHEIGVWHKEINGILFIGTTLYTDFTVPVTWNENGNVEQNMRVSLYGMNDYRFGRISDTKALGPKDYLKWFYSAFNDISDLIEKTEKKEPGKEIVVITHHCPLIDCIDAEYADSTLNASYVSDLYDFIKKHESIKMWCCGHVHNCGVYHCGKTLVVCNPRGYVGYGEGVDFNPDLTVDTEKWEVVDSH